MRSTCVHEIFKKKCLQQQNFDSDPKKGWHYNHVTSTPLAKHFMPYNCRLIYMLSMLYVRLTIKVKVGIPENLKVGWYPHKITGSSHLNLSDFVVFLIFLMKGYILGLIKFLNWYLTCFSRSHDRYGNTTTQRVQQTFRCISCPSPQVCGVTLSSLFIYCQRAAS